MVMLGWSVHLTTIFPGQVVNQHFVNALSIVTDNNPSWISRREEKLFHDQSPQKYGTGPIKHFVDTTRVTIFLQLTPQENPFPP